MEKVITVAQVIVPILVAVLLGVLAVEMESYALYLNAALAGKNALCLCTISDHLYRDEALSSEDRQNSFTQMMEIALDTAVKMSNL